MRCGECRACGWYVGCEELVEYVRCVWLGAAWVDEKIGFGLYQSCGNRGSVGRVSVFWLRWYRWGVGIDQGLEGWCYVCVSCESVFSV